MHSSEVKANIERAEQAVDAARKLASDGYYDFAASRAYYAVFYAASALLLREGLEFRKHSGVIAAIHQYGMRGQSLNSELRIVFLEKGKYLQVLTGAHKASSRFVSNSSDN
jgi:uncharacterized protein (UPF0332 family)